eukprot:TRINITY_DN206_c0_g2_i4.p1 TRINITY_DN206_c0_g2~~TRINITY_DN206_c0_g2_i4.p1  ORF type:complete len:890 (+),score=195.78 TRINITY_DN206_c0_g2_i4:922-3591(+)
MSSYKAAGTSCMNGTTSGKCNPSGICVTSSDLQYCSLIKQSDCSPTTGCKWCHELGRCMDKSIDCNCNSLPSDICQLSPYINSSCTWCNVGIRCVPSWSLCPTCSDFLEDECLDEPLCGWCKSEQKCKAIEAECLNCSTVAYPNCTYALYPGCHRCFAPLRDPPFTCNDKSSACPTCSSFTTSQNCTADPNLGCSWCNSQKPRKCFTNFSPCSNPCTGLDPYSCKHTTQGCRFCEFLQECISANISGVNCSCKDISTEICDSATGCALCDSSNNCRLKRMYDFSQDSSLSVCIPCENLTLSECPLYPGCKTCYTKCVSDATPCVNCTLRSKSSCSNGCSWCSVIGMCQTADFFCDICSGLRPESCEKVTGCYWCKDKCSVEECEQPPLISTMQLIYFSAAFGAIFLLCIFVFSFLRRKNAAILRKHEKMEFSKLSWQTSNQIVPSNSRVHITDIAPVLLIEPHAIYTARWGEPQVPVSIDKMVLDFNKELGGFLQADTAYEQTITFRNLTRSSVLINVRCPKSTEDFAIDSIPCQLTIPGKGIQTATIRLVLKCTIRLLVKLSVVINSQISLDLFTRAESVLSSLISFSEIEKGDTIGEGSFASVFVGKYRGTTVAVKVYKSCSGKRSNMVKREIELLHKMRSPYIVSFLGAVINQRFTCVVMEYCELGSLKKILHDPTQSAIPSSLKMKFAVDAAEGVNFLHQNKVVHRDLKPDNLLVVSLNPQSPACLKLSDFGSSRLFSEGDTNFTKAIGTPIYMAPEELQGDPYTEKVDVYSFAIVLWELWTQKHPFSEQCDNPSSLLFAVTGGVRPTIPADCPYKDLLPLCWCNNPSQRPNIDVILTQLKLKAGMNVSVMNNDGNKEKQSRVEFDIESGKPTRLLNEKSKERKK